MDKVLPLKPDEVQEKKAQSLPNEVLESFNEMIIKNWNGTYSKFKQKDVVEKILSKLNHGKEMSVHIKSEHLFGGHMLDVEDIYREEGWKVEYDKPAYCETYDATFTFSK